MTSPARSRRLASLARRLVKRFHDGRTSVDAVRKVLEVDGPPIPSTLDLPVYTAPKQPQKCDHCGRSSAFFEGCSVDARFTRVVR